jgi:hypothetical protein
VEGPKEPTGLTHDVWMFPVLRRSAGQRRDDEQSQVVLVGQEPRGPRPQRRYPSKVGAELGPVLLGSSVHLGEAAGAVRTDDLQDHRFAPLGPGAVSSNRMRAEDGAQMSVYICIQGGLLRGRSRVGDVSATGGRERSSTGPKPAER